MSKGRHRDYKPHRNKRKKESHEKRYGMNAREWAKFKKTNPQEAHEIRQRALQKRIRPV